MREDKILLGADVAAVIIVFIFWWIYSIASVGGNVLFGDEGYHAEMSKWISENKVLPKWTPLFYETEYSKMGYLRPPLHHTLFAGLNIFGWNESLLKVLLPIFSLITAFTIYILVRNMVSGLAGILSMLIFLLLPTVITHGVLAYSDSLFVMILTVALYTFYKHVKTGRTAYLLFSGIFSGLATITKISGIIMPLFFIVYFALDGLKKEGLRKAAVLFICMVLVASPWLIRNSLLYGSPVCDNYPFLGRFFNNSGCTVGTTQSSGGQEFVGRTANVGSEQNLLNVGVPGFIEFAYGNFFIVFLTISGFLAAILYRKEKGLWIIALFFLVTLTLYQYSTGRSEDVARYVLPVAIPLSILPAFLAYGLGGKENVAYKAGVLFIILIFVIFLIPQALYPPAPSGAAGKIFVMQGVKSFSPDFIKANDWIKLNTPEDSTILSLWTAHTVYLSGRKATWSMPELNDILLSGKDETVMPILKKHGIDYILVAKFSIQIQDYSQVYPLKFVVYLEGSKNFTKIFENDGTIIYKINSEGV